MQQNISLDCLQNPKPSQVFILDIDSTLVTTHQRNQKILDEFILSHDEIYPEDCRQLGKVQCQLGDYGLTSGLQRISFEPKHSQCRASLDQYWRKHFFSNHFLSADQEMPGAVTWTQNLKKWGIDFIFLTARHKSTMWEGTLSSMAKLGFPVTPDNLFLKEQLEDSDAVYKSKKLSQCTSSQSDKQYYLIDNEPVVLQQILTDHPQIHLVWFQSTHSGKAHPPEGVLTIRDFKF